MRQMLHNSYKQSGRPVNSFRLGLADSTICGSCFKGIEWYEAPGAGGEVGFRR